MSLDDLLPMSSDHTFHRETLRLLGIHCFGYQASEIIHIGQAIIKANSYQLQGLSR